MTFELFIPGKPVQQGSKSAWVSTRGAKPRAILHDDNASALKPWRKQATLLAQATLLGDPPLEGALQVEVEFRFERGKTVRRELPSVKPDVDKLQRSLFDALTDARVWKDDAQIVTVIARKRYADTPGVHVRVEEYSPTPSERKQ